MPPKSTIKIQKVVPKGQRKPPVRSYVATTSGSCNEPTLKPVEKPLEREATTATTSSQDYLTLQRVLLEEYEFEQLASPPAAQQPTYSADEEAEMLKQLPENPEDLTTPVKVVSGKVKHSLCREILANHGRRDKMKCLRTGLPPGPRNTWKSCISCTPLPIATTCANVAE